MSLEINTSIYTIYGFTLRKTKKNVAITKELYLEHLTKLSRYGVLGNFTDIVFEDEFGLHCHGIVKICKSTALNRFRVRGWNMRLDEIWDMNQWQLYLNKSQIDLPVDMVDPPDDDFVMPTKRLF